MSLSDLEDLGPATYGDLLREAITDLLEPSAGRRSVNLHTIHTLRADGRHVPWFCSIDTRTSSPPGVLPVEGTPDRAAQHRGGQ